MTAFPACSENELTRLMLNRAAHDSVAMNFFSAGAYRFFSPALINEQINRLQQPDRWRGKLLDDEYREQEKRLQAGLQVLGGLPHCNLLAQDRVSTLAQLLRQLAPQPNKRASVLIAATVAPAIRHALRSQLKFDAIDLVVVDYDKQQGRISPEQLQAHAADDVLAVIIGWPNFFSLLEDIEQIACWSHQQQASLIVLSDPLAMSLLESPCDPVAPNIDFMLGEFISLGLPVNRQGCAPGFVLSAQPLQGDLAQRAGIQSIDEMALIIESFHLLAQPEGLQGVHQSRRLLDRLLQKLAEINQLSIRFSAPHVLECVIRVGAIDLQKAQRILSGHNMLAGYFLADEYPELQDCLLLGCSDLQTQEDIDKFANKISTVVKNLSTAGCPVKPKFDR